MAERAAAGTGGGGGGGGGSCACDCVVIVNFLANVAVTVEMDGPDGEAPC